MALLGLGVAGCTSGLVPTFGAGAPAPAPTANQDANVGNIKIGDYVGTYTIDSVTFDADPEAADFQPTKPLTHTLDSITVGVNGKPQSIQARLDKAYINIGPTGNFSFYYNIVDEKGQVVVVGGFQSGSMSGTIKAGLTTIGFDAGVSHGLADDQETDYTPTKSTDGKTLTLEDTTKKTPTPHFSIIQATKSQ